KLEGLGRAVIAHYFERRAALENVNELIAGEMALPMAFPPELRGGKGAVRGSSTSLWMWSPGSVALQVVPPSAERNRCHVPFGTTAIIPARTSKDLGGPSSHTMSRIFVPSRTCTSSSSAWSSQWLVPAFLPAKRIPSRYGPSSVALPRRSSRVVVGVNPRNMVSFASSAVR